MDYQAARGIANMLAAGYTGYYAFLANGGERLNLPIHSVKYSADFLVHASTLDSCPKKAALEEIGASKPIMTVTDYQTMEIGTQMGQFFYESQVWAHPQMVKDEVYLSDTIKKISGRPDILFHSESGTIPVEVKTTNAFKYAGIAESHLLQCAHYMMLVEHIKPESGEYGIVATLYNPVKDAPEPFHMWLINKRVVGDETRYYILDDDGSPAYLGKFMPGNDYETYVTEAEVMARIRERVEWKDEVKGQSEADWVDSAPYQTPFESWSCGEVKKPRGDTKGEIRIKCGAFGKCWASRLVSKGYDYHLLPPSITIVSEDGKLDFAYAPF